MKSQGLAHQEICRIVGITGNTLRAYLREHPPATIKEAVAKIEELTGILRGETRVRQLADELGIELLYLPSYSPNLNLIERLWKFVKKKVLNSKYYADFGTFKAAIGGQRSPVAAMFAESCAPAVYSCHYNRLRSYRL